MNKPFLMLVGVSVYILKTEVQGQIILPETELSTQQL